MQRSQKTSEAHSHSITRRHRWVEVTVVRTDAASASSHPSDARAMARVISDSPCLQRRPRPHASTSTLHQQIVFSCAIALCCFAAGTLSKDVSEDGQQQLHPRGPLQTLTRICPSVNIREYADFKQLRDCEIINGAMYITYGFYDNALTEDDSTRLAANVSFPMLREITDFLLIYQSTSLVMLTDMFPNLAVIRGTKLMQHYALVILSNPRLEEIGLNGLTEILNGGVRIMHNPRLCYIASVDWATLVVGDIYRRDHIVIRSNSMTDICRNICPHRCRTRPPSVAPTSPAPTYEMSRFEIRRGPINSGSVGDTNASSRPVKHCWSASRCQRMRLAVSDNTECQSVASSLSLNETTTTAASKTHLHGFCYFSDADTSKGLYSVCPTSCAGGCRATSTSSSPLVSDGQKRPLLRQCVACRHFYVEVPFATAADAIGSVPDNGVVGGKLLATCVDRCPANLLVLSGWLCIRRTDCMHIFYVANKLRKSFRVYNGTCIKRCPANTEETTDPVDGTLTCRLCDGGCSKECYSGYIQSIGQIQNFAGCTIINGPMHIQVRGANVVELLHKYLGHIREIRGHLLITRTPAVKSLDFFRSLEVIRGIQFNNDSSLPPVPISNVPPYPPTGSNAVARDSANSSGGSDASSTSITPFFSLYLISNKQLEKLFPVTTMPDGTNRTVQIYSQDSERGRVQIHDNDMLCLSEIRQMVRLSNVYDSGTKSTDISYVSNGDKASCGVNTLNVSLTFPSNEIMLVLFDNYQRQIIEQYPEADYRVLLSYQINYQAITQAAYLSRNVSKEPSGELCTDEWTRFDRLPSAADELIGAGQEWPIEQVSIPVRPYTHYAVYIGTTLMREFSGVTGVLAAESDVVYGLSPVARPGAPNAILVTKVDAQSVNVSWVAPTLPNGVIDHYELVFRRVVVPMSQVTTYCMRRKSAIHGSGDGGDGNTKSDLHSDDSFVDDGGNIVDDDNEGQSSARSDSDGGAKTGVSGNRRLAEVMEDTVKAGSSHHLVADAVSGGLISRAVAGNVPASQEVCTLFAAMCSSSQRPSHDVDSSIPVGASGGTLLRPAMNVLSVSGDSTAASMTSTVVQADEVVEEHRFLDEVIGRVLANDDTRTSSWSTYAKLASAPASSLAGDRRGDSQPSVIDNTVVGGNDAAGTGFADQSWSADNEAATSRVGDGDGDGGPIDLENIPLNAMTPEQLASLDDDEFFRRLMTTSGGDLSGYQPPQSADVSGGDSVSAERRGSTQGWLAGGRAGGGSGVDGASGRISLHTTPMPTSRIINGTTFWDVYSKQIPATHTIQSLHVSSLQYFGVYRISLRACHAPVQGAGDVFVPPSDFKSDGGKHGLTEISAPVTSQFTKLCSTALTYDVRVLPLPGADDIPFDSTAAADFSNEEDGESVISVVTEHGQLRVVTVTRQIFALTPASARKASQQADITNDDIYVDATTGDNAPADVGEIGEESTRHVSTEMSQRQEQTKIDVYLTWTPPRHPNGVITHYRIYMQPVTASSLGDEDDGDSTLTGGVDDSNNDEEISAKPTAQTSSGRGFATCVTAQEFARNGNRHLLQIAGLFDVSVQPVSLFGPANWTTSVRVRGYFEAGGSLSDDSLLMGGAARRSLILVISLSIVVPIVFVALCLALFVVYFRHRKARDQFQSLAMGNPSYVATRYKADKFEVARKFVDIGHEIGSGAFGTVFTGVLHHEIRGPIPCAVKTIRPNASFPECQLFLNEANVMKELRTAHIVRLLGVVSNGQPHLLLLEMMAKGDLRAFLRSHRPDDPDENKDGRSPPTGEKMCQMALEIADGMAFLSTSTKRIVHRDLAARNCMVTADEVVKIGDFGMAREIYTSEYYKKVDKGLMPIRWMSPESLRDGKATSASDVWSYGVVLWEICTLGEQPYRGQSNQEVVECVLSGHRLGQPDNAPDALARIMIQCFHDTASKRPNFVDICVELMDAFKSSNRFIDDSFITSKTGHDVIKRNQVEREERAIVEQMDSIDAAAATEADSPPNSDEADCDPLAIAVADDQCVDGDGDIFNSVQPRSGNVASGMSDDNHREEWMPLLLSSSDQAFDNLSGRGHVVFSNGSGGSGSKGRQVLPSRRAMRTLSGASGVSGVSFGGLMTPLMENSAEQMSAGGGESGGGTSDDSMRGYVEFDGGVLQASHATATATEATTESSKSVVTTPSGTSPATASAEVAACPEKLSSTGDALDATVMTNSTTLSSVGTDCLDGATAATTTCREHVTLPLGLELTREVKARSATAADDSSEFASAGGSELCLSPHFSAVASKTGHGVASSASINDCSYPETPVYATISVSDNNSDNNGMGDTMAKTRDFSPLTPPSFGSRRRRQWTAESAPSPPPPSSSIHYSTVLARPTSSATLASSSREKTTPPSLASVAPIPLDRTSAARPSSPAGNDGGGLTHDLRHRLKFNVMADGIRRLRNRSGPPLMSHVTTTGSAVVSLTGNNERRHGASPNPPAHFIVDGHCDSETVDSASGANIDSCIALATMQDSDREPSSLSRPLSHRHPVGEADMPDVSFVSP